LVLRGPARARSIRRGAVARLDRRPGRRIRGCEGLGPVHQASPERGDPPGLRPADSAAVESADTTLARRMRGRRIRALSPSGLGADAFVAPAGLSERQPAPPPM